MVGHHTILPSYDYCQIWICGYDHWHEELPRKSKNQIDGDQFNFVEDPEATQKVLAMVDEALAKVRKLKQQLESSP